MIEAPTVTLARAGWLLRMEGQNLIVARSEHSDWFEVPVEDVPRFLADVHAITQAWRSTQ